MICDAVSRLTCFTAQSVQKACCPAWRPRMRFVSTMTQPLGCSMHDVRSYLQKGSLRGQPGGNLWARNEKKAHFAPLIVRGRAGCAATCLRASQGGSLHDWRCSASECGAGQPQNLQTHISHDSVLAVSRPSMQEMLKALMCCETSIFLLACLAIALWHRSVPRHHAAPVGTQM